MLNVIWLLMLVAGIGCGLIFGNGEAVSAGLTAGAVQSVEVTLALLGAMMLWCGVMEVAQRSGFAKKLSNLLSLLLKPLFRGLKRDDAAMQAVCMNISANALGLGNAATPFGLKAMQELQKRNPDKKTASREMIALIVINSTVIQFLPTTVINLRIAAKSAAPFAIVGLLLIATAATMTVSVLALLLVNRK